MAELSPSLYPTNSFRWLVEAGRPPRLQQRMHHYSTGYVWVDVPTVDAQPAPDAPPSDLRARLGRAMYAAGGATDGDGRGYPKGWGGNAVPRWEQACHLQLDAIIPIVEAEIRAVEQDAEALARALEPFANYAGACLNTSWIADRMDGERLIAAYPEQHGDVVTQAVVTMGDFRAALAAHRARQSGTEQTRAGVTGAVCKDSLQTDDGEGA